MFYKSACLAILLMVVLALVVADGAQSANEERSKFDVTSVKPNKSGGGVIGLSIQPGGRVIATDIPLKQLIRAAFTLQLYQIVDGPSWIESERFDVTAVTGRELREPATWTPGGQFATVQLMLQSLLVDRFNFRAHFEEREGPVYALVRDTAGRSTLTPAKTPCTSACGMRVGSGTLTARGVPLPQLAELLSQITGRLVTDVTGLVGDFDFDLRWMPE